MHRILLYAMVVALLYFAWDSRSEERLAREPRAGAKVAARPEGPLSSVRVAADALLSESDVTERLEARVAARLDAFGEGLVELAVPEPGTTAEVVLADAERWMESHFPEGGRTDETESAELAQSGTVDLRGGTSTSDASKAGERVGEEIDAASGEPSALYVATLARIECLNGDLPAWCGLLDLALRPPMSAGSPPFGAAAAGGDALEPGDSAWLCDDTGKLLARVEALDGVGLELDPTWPWSLRQRRLFWAEGGATGMPARQYRLVLEGSAFGPAWTGRLVLVHTRPPTHR